SAATARGRSTAGRGSRSGAVAGATDIGPGRRSGSDVVGQASVRADRPEAVGAVDRAVHTRLERHLGLVAAGRADHREVLACRPVVAALVAARAADVAHVVA